MNKIIKNNSVSTVYGITLHYPAGQEYEKKLRPYLLTNLIRYLRELSKITEAFDAFRVSDDRASHRFTVRARALQQTTLAAFT